ncbi:MAG: hypothetical protein QG657_389 [Acidobacteriota bacterium]|nr:hypothetical protein [Acidobacteriota bacterium]
MDVQTVKKIIKEDVPVLMKSNKAVRQFFIQLAKEQITKSNKKTAQIETKMDRRFDKILAQFEKDREEQKKKWAENDKKWLEFNKRQDKKWAEQDKKWDEQNKKWDEQNKKWDEHIKSEDKKWAEQNKKWDEQNEKWKENQVEISKLVRSVERLSQRIDTGIGALGARWGLRSEASFRNALKDILETFNINVSRVEEYDDEGEVFGWPAQVELDIIIMNGELMIGELKSSTSFPDVCAFYKKARFYEKKHARKAQRLFLVSPMVDKRAMEMSKKFGIKIYSYAEQIGDELTSGPTDVEA